MIEFRVQAFGGLGDFRVCKVEGVGFGGLRGLGFVGVRVYGVKGLSSWRLGFRVEGLGSSGLVNGLSWHVLQVRGSGDM